MRSPDRNRNGGFGYRTGGDDLALRYLSPGAFTILSPEENGIPPDPPRAPPPYRLAPKVKRNRSQAFAIIAEPIPSRPASRSPSPSGRVSPFRGRGFNPKGSRHDIPPDLITGPPPEDIRTSPLIFGERVTHGPPSKFRRKAASTKLGTQKSKSLTNVSKPPVSPSRYGAYPKGSRKLSPISGSSPESRKSSKIPKRSRSQPVTRKPSPAVKRKASSKPPTKAPSKAPAKKKAEPPPPEPKSPSKTAAVTSPSKKYSEVKAKVDTGQAPVKEEVPKTSEESGDTTSSTSPKKVPAKNIKAQKLKNARSKVALGLALSKSSTRSLASAKLTNVSASATSVASTTTSASSTGKPELARSDSKESSAKVIKDALKKQKKIIKLADLLPDANSVVSSTTSTVANPLKLEFEKIDSQGSSEEKPDDKIEKAPETPYGGELTSTSVSSAMNRMNDTVLDSKTVMGTPASTIVSMAHETKKEVETVKIETISTDDDKKSKGSAHSKASTKVDPAAPTQTFRDRKNFFSTKVKVISTFLGTGDRKHASSRLTSASSIKSLVRGPSAKRKPSATSSKLSSLSKIPQEDEQSKSSSTDLGTINQEEEKEKESSDSASAAAAALPTIHDDNESKLSVDTKKSGAISPGKPGLKGGASLSSHLSHMDKNVNNNFTDSSKQSVGLGSNAPSAFTKVEPKVEPEDVQPLRITVQERPHDGEVQSGNIRLLPVSATNGVNTSPGLPPSQPQDNDQTQKGKKPNICSRLLTTCRSKISHKADNDGKAKPKNDEEKQSRFNCCKRKRVEDGSNVEDMSDKAGCFSCCRSKKSGAHGDNAGFFSCCRKKRKTESAEKICPDDEMATGGCFSCCRKPKRKDRITVNVEEVDAQKKSCWDRLKCCRTNKVGDKSKGKWWSKNKEKKDSWADRRDSILSDPKPKPKRTCKNILRSIFCCCSCCKKKNIGDDPLSRRISTMSKNKSLSPVNMPLEDMRPKLDLSLVEHTSVMKGAIPVLPLSLAWFCCMLNVFLPGIGTIFSGMFCMCMGKARFSQRDGAQQRIGSFVINFIIGFGQAFTVLFCLVGWGWSIWWGVIMIKVAKRQRKLKIIEDAEKAEEARQAQAQAQAANNHRGRDVERGRVT